MYGPYNSHSQIQNHVQGYQHVSSTSFLSFVVVVVDYISVLIESVGKEMSTDNALNQLRI